VKLARALDLVGAHCDLEQRLRDIPPSARARGIWVRTFENALGRRSGAMDQYLAIFESAASPLGWEPLGEVVARLAVAGAIYTSPREVREGLRLLARTQAVSFADSLLGRTLIRLLAPDPVRVLQQGAAARRQTCNYGSWEHDFSTPGRAIVTHRDEYGWLDSQVLGSAEGTLDAIKVRAEIAQRLDDPYNGVTVITWGT
jgi:uncharacterized protein (TIGR02265 family)